ncbi:MAG: YncE family protein [Rhodothermales bacterium]
MIQRTSTLIAGLTLALLFVVSSACGSTARLIDPAGEAAVSVRAGQLIYICNQSSASVSIVDATTLELVETVDLTKFGVDKNAKPHHIAVEPDGSFWYVSLIGANRVFKLNRENELVGQAEFEAPGLLALHPTRDLLFVGRSMMAVNPPQRIGMITRSDMAIEEVDVFFPRPHAIVIDPRGEYVFVGSLAENRFLSYNIDTEAIELYNVDGPINTFVQFAISPDAHTLVVGGQMTGKVFIYDITRVPAIQLVETLDVKAAPWHPVFSPDNRYVYLGNKMANTISVIDMQTRKVAKLIEGEGISQPHGSALSADGRYLFVSNSNLPGGGQAMMKMMAPGGGGHDAHAGHAMEPEKEEPGTLVVIDTKTDEIVKVIPLNLYPSGMGTNAR